MSALNQSGQKLTFIQWEQQEEATDQNAFSSCAIVQGLGLSCRTVFEAEGKFWLFCRQEEDPSF